MSRLLGLAHALRSLLRRDAAATETAEEMAFHIDRQAHKHVAAGMPPDEARRLAELEFGGVARWREERRDVGFGHVLDRIIQDAQYASRTLRNQRTFAAVAVLTLSIAIGATTAAYTLVDRILLRPLPYPSANRLVSVVETNGNARQGGFAFSLPNLLDLESEARSFAALVALRSYDAPIGDGDNATLVRGASVYGDFARTLAFRPLFGRLLTADDAREGAPATILLSYDLWQRRFGGDPAVVGRAIKTGGSVPATVVGVTPRWFRYPDDAQFWTACTNCKRVFTLRTGINFDVVARLASRATFESARAEVGHIGDALHARFPKFADNQMTSATIIALQEAQVSESRHVVLGLGGAVACILLIACANLASANLARNTSRWHEFTLRVALGASRSRIIMQLFVESLMLSMIGGVLGLAGAWIAVRGVVQLGAGRLPRLTEVGIDLTTVVCAFVLCVSIALVIGFAPATRITIGDLRTTLARGARGTVGGGSRMRHALVALDFALSVVLLTGAGLATRSLQRVLREPLGIDANGVLTVQPQFRGAAVSRHQSDAAAVRYYQSAIDGISNIPGVVGAAVSSTGPLTSTWTGFVQIERMPDDPHPVAGYNVVSERYFDVLGIPLLAGRVFTAADDSSGPHLAVINRAMAERYWPGRNPLGMRFRQTVMDSHADTWLTVIGIVGNVKTFSLEQDDFPIHYVSWRQRPERVLGGAIVARTSLRADAVSASVRTIVQSIDRGVPVNVESLDERVRITTATRRLTVSILSAFAAIALALAAIGIYGVLSYTVALRTREIGVRMALGADRRRVLGMVVGDASRPVAVGLIAGLVFARLLSQLMEGLVYKLSPGDPVTLGGAIAVLVVLSVAAAYLPARRAARVDPLISMRAE